MFLSNVQKKSICKAKQQRPHRPPQQSQYTAIQAVYIQCTEMGYDLLPPPSIKG